MIKKILRTWRELTLIINILRNDIKDKKSFAKFQSDILEMIEIEVERVVNNQKLHDISSNYLTKNAPSLVQSYQKLDQSNLRLCEPKYDFEMLDNLPDSSFGKKFSQISKNFKHIDPKIPSKITLTDFYKIRLLISHDMLHTLLDADFDGFGEIAIFGFYAGQFFNPLSLLFLNLFIVQTTTKLDTVGANEFMYGFCQGYMIGKNAVDISGVILEDMLEEDLEIVRKQLNITKLIYGPNSYNLIPFVKNRI